MSNDAHVSVGPEALRRFGPLLFLRAPHGTCCSGLCAPPRCSGLLCVPHGIPELLRIAPRVFRTAVRAPQVFRVESPAARGRPASSPAFSAASRGRPGSPGLQPTPVPQDWRWLTLLGASSQPIQAPAPPTSTRSQARYDFSVLPPPVAVGFHSRSRVADVPGF